VERGIFVKFLWQVIGHSGASEPEAATIVDFASIACDVVSPLAAFEVVRLAVASQDAEEDVVVHPL